MDPSSATSTRRFWPPISIQQTPFPRVPDSGTPPCWEGAEPRLRAAYEFDYPTRKCGAASASQLRYPRRESASAQKSTRSSPRATSPAAAAERGNGARTLGTSGALARRGLSVQENGRMESGAAIPCCVRVRLPDARRAGRRSAAPLDRSYRCRSPASSPPGPMSHPP